MSINKHRARRLAAALALVGSALPFVAFAQQDAGALQEVIVTAQKRAANLQDVPFSVTATSQEQIRNSGAADLSELSRNIGGFYVADLGPGQSQVAIRGISSGQVIRDQPGVKEQVGVYLDESPISVALFTPDMELFDLDRFEVLRGPQGTLFGAGSEAGTVRYITRQPVLGKLEVSMDSAFEDVTHGDEGGYLRSALNLPLGDMAAARIVTYWHHLPGFIDAIQPGGSVKSAVNDGDRSGIRASVLIKPTEALSITPRIIFQKLQTNGYPREDAYNILANQYMTTQPAITIGSLQQYTQQHEGLTDDFTLADLKLDYDFGPATVTSISSFTHRNVLVLRDATQLTGSVTYDVFGTTPGFNQADVRISSPLYDRTHLNVFSQEVRVGSNGHQFIDWLVGGFFQHVGRRYGQDLPTPGYDALNAQFGFPLGPNPVGLVDTPFFSDLSYRLKQYAAFGEGTVHFTDQLAFTAGLRYYKFNEDRVLNFNGVFSAATPPGGVPGSTDSSGVSPRFIFSYKATPDVQFNVEAARGFRLGGINDPINLPLCSPVDKQVFGGLDKWKDEKAWNYEVGMKSQWLDHRVTFNVDAFYEDIKDLQATTTAGTCSSRVVINVPTSRATGVEAELFARPTPVFDFGLSATYVDKKLTSSVVSTLPSGQQIVVGGLAEGNTLPTSAKFQGAASAGFTVPVQNATDLFGLVTLQYVGSSFSQFENEQPGWGQIGGGANDPNAARLITFGGVPANTVITFNNELDSYTLVNLRLGLKTDRWQAAAYVNNVGDKIAHLALDYERGRSARVGYLVNQPRTFGLYGAYNW